VEQNIGYPKKKAADLSNVPWTKPAAGTDYYARRLTERLAFSEPTKANYEKYLIWKNSNDPKAEVDFTPIAGHISPNSQCNFKCTMCSVSDFERGKRCEDMSKEIFEKRLNQLPGLVEISLVGLSELFMMNESLEDMLRMCVERKLWTKISTNASLLHQRNWINRIVSLNLDEITISIDGTTKKVFESIRRKSNFEKVIQNSRSLNDALNNFGISPPRTKMVTVLQSENRDQLFDFIPFAKKLGFTSLAFETEPFDWGSASWRDKNSKVSQILEPENFVRLVNQGQEHGVEVGFVEIVQRFSTQPEDHALCSWPFSKIFISSDDRVVPCCHISNPDHFEIEHGIGENRSVVDVWFGDDYRSFRQNHISGNIPEACRSCYK
jgi:pyrroloquinoline quinone biosynthesis protein E